MMMPFVIGRVLDPRARGRACDATSGSSWPRSTTPSRRAAPGGHLRGRRRRHRRPEPEAAQRQHQGAGRRRAPRADPRVRANAPTTSPVVGRGACRAARVGSVESARYMAKVLALFEQYAKLSHHLAFEGAGRVAEDRRPGARSPTRSSAHLVRGDRREAEPARDRLPLRALQKLQDILEVEIDKLKIDRRITTRSRSRWRRRRRSTTSTRR